MTPLLVLAYKTQEVHYTTHAAACTSIDVVGFIFFSAIRMLAQCYSADHMTPGNSVATWIKHYIAYCTLQVCKYTYVQVRSDCPRRAFFCAIDKQVTPWPAPLLNALSSTTQILSKQSRQVAYRLSEGT